MATLVTFRKKVQIGLKNKNGDRSLTETTETTEFRLSINPPASKSCELREMVVRDFGDDRNRGETNYTNVKIMT